MTSEQGLTWALLGILVGVAIAVFVGCVALSVHTWIWSRERFAHYAEFKRGHANRMKDGPR